MILCHQLTCSLNARAPNLHPTQRHAGAGRCMGTWDEARDDVIREVEDCERYREWRPGEVPESVRRVLEAEDRATEVAAGATGRRGTKRSA